MPLLARPPPASRPRPVASMPIQVLACTCVPPRARAHPSSPPHARSPPRAPSFPRLRALFAPSLCRRRVPPVPSSHVFARLACLARLVSLVPSRPSRRRRAVVVAPTSTRLRAVTPFTPSSPRGRRPLAPSSCPSRASPRRAPRPVAPLRLVLVAPSRPLRPQLLASRPLGLFVSPRPPLRAVAPVPCLCAGRASSRPRCTLMPARAVLAPSRLRAVVAPPRRHAGVVCSHRFRILAPLLPHPPSHPLCARVT
ncbi:hypothetical protein DENSPDRAFT_887031 [Dentipellis sp. KUC8613]|nr:hypothetical protein DENSPDRAFT_887031 [Dentipellis sp. KUC8613]